MSTVGLGHTWCQEFRLDLWQEEDHCVLMHSFSTELTGGQGTAPQQVALCGETGILATRLKARTQSVSRTRSQALEPASQDVFNGSWIGSILTKN